MWQFAPPPSGHSVSMEVWVVSYLLLVCKEVGPEIESEHLDTFIEMRRFCGIQIHSQQPCVTVKTNTADVTLAWWGPGSMSSILVFLSGTIFWSEMHWKLKKKKECWSFITYSLSSIGVWESWSFHTFANVQSFSFYSFRWVSSCLALWF